MAPGTTFDTATLDVAPPPSTGWGAPPTGSITFDLYGPDDAACAGPVFFTSTVPVNGFGDYVSATANVAAPGTYRWVATYSGDANYVGSSTACGDPDETVVFTPAVATIVTSATPTVTVGSPISDTATVTGAPAPAPAPTGTVVFTLFGPDDATCAGAGHLHQRARGPGRRPATDGQLGPVHAHRSGHLPLDRGLQR